MSRPSSASRVGLHWLAVLVVLHAVPRPAAAVDDRPIPQNPERQAQRHREMLEWNRRSLIGAYEKVGKKDPRWDAVAREALEAAARIFSHQTDPVVLPLMIFAPAKRALDAGCDDPLVLYLYARYSDADPANRPSEEEVRRRYETAAFALERSKYPAIRRWTPLSRLGLIKAFEVNASSQTRKEAARQLDAALALLPRSVAEDERSPDLENFWFLLLQSYIQGYRRLDGDHEAAFRRIDAVLPKEPTLKAIRLQVEGDFLITYAWEARGSGVASTITEEGGRLFAERLARARKVLEEAWALRPNNPKPATLMLTVEMGIGGDRDEMEKWFARAMEADGDNLAACLAKLEWIDPKWHGTVEDLLAYGRACRDTKNWWTGITLIVADAHFRAAFQIEEVKRYKYLQSVEVWDDIRGVFEEYLKHRPNDETSRSLYAGYCYLCDRDSEAKRQFQILGDHLVGTNQFTKQTLEQARNKIVNAPRRSAEPETRRQPAELLPGFRPLALAWDDPSGATGTLTSIEQCVPTDAGFDILMDSKELYLLKDPKRAIRIYHDAGYGMVMSVCHDGRYVWAAIRSGDEPPFLLVIDPVSLKTWRIVKSDGLPLLSSDELPAREGQFLTVAPIEPGKICLAGSHKTSWIATVAFAPGTRPTIRTFHEARDERNEKDPDDWKRTTVKFRPAYMVTLTPPATAPVPGGVKAGRRILVGRSGSSGNNLHPLIVDPESLSVEPLPATIGFLSRGSVFPGSFAVHEGRFYWVETGRTLEGTLMRIGLPDLAAEPLVRGVLDADKVVISGDRVHIAGGRWWEGSLTDREAQPLSIKIPWLPFAEYYARSKARSDAGDRGPSTAYRLFGIGRSHHLGLLAIVQGGRSIDRVTYQVDLKDAESQARAQREPK